MNRCIQCCMRVGLLAGAFSALGLQAEETSPIDARNITDAERWQTVFEAKPLTWRWPDAAVRAEVTVTNVASRKVSRHLVVRTDLAAAGGLAVPELAPSDDGERLFDVAVSFSDGTSAVGEPMAARMATLPGRITVSPVSSREFTKVSKPDRLLFCAAGEALTATPVDGEPVTVVSPVREGYNAVNAGRFFSPGVYFTFAEDDLLVSPLLRYAGSGMILIFR